MREERARYETVADEITEAYLRGDHTEGVALARAAMPDLPAWRADLAHLAACLLALGGRPEEAYEELRAAFAAGAWWHRRILLEDDDLADLAGIEGFADFVRESQARADAAADTTRPPLLRRPEGEPHGLLVTLHGAGEEAEDAATEWAAALDAGCVLLAVDSSQRNTPTYRSWPDPEVAARDIATAVAGLDAADRDLPLVTGGFSAGARPAMRWALAGSPGTPVGFVAVAPAVFPTDLDPALVRAGADRGVPGVILLGEKDDDVGEGAQATYESLRQAGLACRLDVVPGLGHTYPDDFDVRLRIALSSLARN
ncbi:phospholipase [Actinopolymorpha pittospori]|uniref:Esterase n=1 Tax=Actinopolymorpha pittospori TaxID=648752 RepID=A0A927N6H3_9ACTN|nr:phospholipase [Actinopolymorpha pittospori]MBE1611873.1 putative esterase [Actinopolymorpha pittospori]